MIKFGLDTIQPVFDLGKEAAEYVSRQFTKPISLEFEKVYFPYLLISKKRYAGLYWSQPEHYDKMDCKGIETVRRDNCPLVKNVIDTCLRKILMERDVAGSIDYVKRTSALRYCQRHKRRGRLRESGGPHLCAGKYDTN
jgi:DNA polymerase delta subunit 1